MGFQNSMPPLLPPGTGTSATPIVPVGRVRRRPGPVAPSAARADTCRDEAASPDESRQALASGPAPGGNAAGLPPGASFDDQLALYRATTKNLREQPRHIIERVADQHGMLPAHITGDQRAKQFVSVRYKAIAEMRRIYPEKSLPWLGRQFNRDHTTILHALRKLGMYP